MKKAWRRLARQPGFALTAVAVLTLGVAAPTALFAVVHATLLRPLPYRQPDDIYTVRTTMTDGRFTIGLVASAEMNALRRATDAVVQSALMRRTDGAIVTESGTRPVAAYVVSVGFFELFGATMEAGRAFDADDLKSWLGSRLVLSHRAWRTLFAGDPQIVGRTIRFADGPGSLVIGVAPASFGIPADADVYMAAPVDDSIGHGWDAFVRLAPGVAPPAVQARLGPMWEELAQKYPDQARNRVFVMRPLLDAIVGDVGPIVLIAFAATGLVLLLAVVNVGNLLLVRGTSRSREMALRMALGATRRDIARHLLAESLLLAGAATLLALPLAYAAIRSIVAIGGSSLPRAGDMQLHPVVFVFAAGVMVVSAIVVALAPAAALRAHRPAALMNEGGRSALQGRSTRRVLSAMIVAEVALAIALVSGAGRLVLSMRHLSAIDPGFTTDGRLAIDAVLPVRPYLAQPPRLFAWLQQAEERLRSIGATGVGTATSLPFRREWDSTTFVDITGRPTDPASRPNARLRIVSPGFFDVMRIPIVTGRSFTAADRAGAEPVVLINEAWARKFLAGLDPLRERIAPGYFGSVVDGKFVQKDAAIVGIVRDVPYTSLTAAAEPTVYVSAAQVPNQRETLIITAADGHPERLIPQVREALAAIDPLVAIDTELLSDVVSHSLAWPRLGVLLMTTFGVAGIVLAASGVFGVVAFVAAARSGEMAVRLALGATRARIFRLFVVETALLATAGLVAGVLLAWWLCGPMARYVYRVSPANPLVLGGSAALVFAIAVVATLAPAGRAAATEPKRVLR